MYYHSIHQLFNTHRQICRKDNKHSKQVIWPAECWLAIEWGDCASVSHDVQSHETAWPCPLGMSNNPSAILSTHPYSPQNWWCTTWHKSSSNSFIYWQHDALQGLPKSHHGDQFNQREHNKDKWTLSAPNYNSVANLQYRLRTETSWIKLQTSLETSLTVHHLMQELIQ